MKRWQSFRAVTTSDFERITTFCFPDRDLAEISGSSLNRRSQLQKKKKAQEGAKELIIEQLKIDNSIDLNNKDRNQIDKCQQKNKSILKSMSIRSARKIRNKITAMYRVGMAKTFVTLTFVNDVSDQIAIRCLQKLWKHWRDQWGKFDFLWTVERQENGRVHFHCIVDKFMDVKKENARWVRMQYNSGIIFKKNDKEIDPTNMTSEEISKILNPFDVRKIVNNESLSAYLATYVTKKIGELYQCQVWNCSKGVSALFTNMFISTEDHQNFIENFPGAKNTYVLKKDVVDKKTGEIKYKAGHIFFPVDKSNDYAHWTYILNKKNADIWLIELDEINTYVRDKKLSEKDIIYYSYRQYCNRYQTIDYLEWREYRKRYYGKQNLDVKNFNDIKNRNLVWEYDYYQMSLAYNKHGLFAMYSSLPRFDFWGKRWYGGKKITEEAIMIMNKYIE